MTETKPVVAVWEADANVQTGVNAGTEVETEREIDAVNKAASDMVDDGDGDSADRAGDVDSGENENAADYEVEHDEAEDKAKDKAEDEIDEGAGAAVRHDDAAAVLGTSAHALVWESDKPRRLFVEFRAACHAPSTLSAADLETWWAHVDAEEQARALETFRWFMENTKSYLAFMVNCYHQQIAQQVATARSCATQPALKNEPLSERIVGAIDASDAVVEVVDAVTDDCAVTDSADGATVGDGVGEDADLATLQRAADAAYTAWQAAAVGNSPIDLAEVNRLWEVWDTLCLRLAVVTNTLSAQAAAGHCGVSHLCLMHRCALRLW